MGTARGEVLVGEGIERLESALDGRRRLRRRTLVISISMHAALVAGGFFVVRPAFEPAPALSVIELAPNPAELPGAKAAEPPPPEAKAPVEASAAAAPHSGPLAPNEALPDDPKPSRGAPGAGAPVDLGIEMGNGPDGFTMPAGEGDPNGVGHSAARSAPPPPPPPPPTVAPCREAPARPVPIDRPTAIAYTARARSLGAQGRLVLNVVVRVDGTVQDVQVTESVEPSLDAAAVSAVRAWRFQPATRCGKAAAGIYTVARRFELGD